MGRREGELFKGALRLESWRHEYLRVGIEEGRGSGKHRSLHPASVGLCSELTQVKAGTGNWYAGGELVSGCRESGGRKAGQQPQTKGHRARERPEVGSEGLALSQQASGERRGETRVVGGGMRPREGRCHLKEG